MKSRLLAAMFAAVVLAAPAASFADGGAYGGAYVFSSRSFSDNDPGVFGPYRYKYRNSANTEVQAELTRLGYYHGPIDGNVKPGTPTSRAIANYQRVHHLPVTGAIDGDLIASLNPQ